MAGVLDHKKWTDRFGDEPLKESLNLTKLPDVPQLHFVGAKDEIVPPELTETWTDKSNVRVVPDATHDDFKDLKIFD